MRQQQPIESSIIIPVFNQWGLTRNCLVALRKTLKGKACEVIVIDNASTDATKSLCLPLGKELLGENFHYHRSETNLNFGPASNLGARKARGEFLVFLNNDTVPLPGWYDPLIEDFTTYPDIAATGPLLLYPEEGPLGRTVQHLGVFFTPHISVGHLYERIPEKSALAQKRRFFQVITGACLVIKKTLFLETGMFDEAFINGYEDIDLCLRLRNKGLRMTVNPTARVIHHTSQTQGRFEKQEYNARLLFNKAASIVTPDRDVHLKNDKLEIQLTPWQHEIVSYSQEQIDRLDKILDRWLDCGLDGGASGQLGNGPGGKLGDEQDGQDEQGEPLGKKTVEKLTNKADEALGAELASTSIEQLRGLLLDFPYWEKGYLALMARLEEQGADIRLLQTAYDTLFKNESTLLARYQRACAGKNEAQKMTLRNVLLSMCFPYDAYVKQAQNHYSRLTAAGASALAELYKQWLDNHKVFRDTHYLPMLYAMFTLENPSNRLLSFEQYIADGYPAGNAIFAEFDIGFYKKQYPELSGSGFPPFIHYVLKGKAEGALYRKPESLIQQ